ncbi:uncharacterized protein B0J16DRAFT_324234 [Fusarium flagelliforme]|uniref:uncharacterized protein n=1 Tax=Fusarium flagelliforme TaxID=2675880 RepID=UPI001E8D6BC9|nr:uncharacterized protein B0J16DRAFT_324234 [Fusarium flagelliforme]KAH7174777.1 hypothetical protein B0J16DRAFT_324234 [Fusarium flagelliforme]
MSDQDQARLNQAKESLLAAGKQAQKEKDAAKADYEKEKEYGMVSDDQPLAQWCATNACRAQYSTALQLCDGSAAEEWEQAQSFAFGKLLRAGNTFESKHFIGLPEE